MEQFSLGQIKNFLTIKKSGKTTFWASDFGFNGGEIAALSPTFIQPTGKTKKEILKLSNSRTKEVEVSEWKLTDYSQYPKEYVEWFECSLGWSIKNILDAAEFLHELGF